MVGFCEHSTELYSHKMSTMSLLSMEMLAYEKGQFSMVLVGF
jgi:hypothetical protein